MTNNSTKLPVLGSDPEIAVGVLDKWFDPIEAGLRDRVRELIQTMIESELEAVLSRPRYARRPKADPENNGAGRCRRPPARSPIALAAGCRRSWASTLSSRH
jgi:hypothetical protein